MIPFYAFYSVDENIAFTVFRCEVSATTAHLCVGVDHFQRQMNGRVEALATQMHAFLKRSAFHRILCTQRS